MIEIKEFLFENATIGEWRDCHKVWNTFYAELRPEDDPTELEKFIDLTKNAFGANAAIGKEFTVYTADKIVGVGSLKKFNGSELVNADIIVMPEFRKQGIGREVMDKLCKDSKILGFKKLFLSSVDKIPSGEHFLEKIGAKKGLVHKGNQLKFIELDTEMMKKWVGSACNQAFECGTWINEIPAEFMEKYVKAINFINDAPHGEIENMDAKMTVESVKTYLELNKKAGNDLIISWVKNVQNTEFVAISVIVIRKIRPCVAFQGDTVTVPKYRGNGFGKLVKALNALYLIENRPEILGNLGHSIEKEKTERIYIEKNNSKKLSSVNFFTFEPHIGQIGGKWGFKHENIYYFDDDGRIKEL